MFGVAMALLIVFHRPLAHWAIWHFGSRMAKQAGLEAAWKSSGSVWSDLAFGGVRVAGGERSVVNLVTADQVALEYNLWRLRDEGPGTVVDKVVLRHVTADVDLTRGRQAGAASEAGRRGAGARSFPAIRIPVIEIERLSLRLRLPSGLVEVQDFSLTIDPARVGTIRVVRLSAPGLPELRDASGSTTATMDSVALGNVSLWPEVVVERLAWQLADLSAERLGVDVLARQGPAAGSVKGTIDFGNPTGPNVAASARFDQVSSATLAFWGVPDGGVDWNAGEVELNFNGPVVRPDQLAASLVLNGATLSNPSVPVASVSGMAEMKEGTIHLTEVKVAAGLGTARASGTAALPPSWATVAASAGQARVEFNVASLEEWTPKATGLSGAATGTIEAGFAQRQLTSATARIQGDRIGIQGLPVERATAVINTTDGGRFQLNSEFRLNEGNTAGITGWLEPRDDQAFEGAWTTECRDLATVLVDQRSHLPWPTEGSLASRGAVSGSLAAIRAREWSRLTGTVEVDGHAVKLREGFIHSLQVRAHAEEGVVSVDTLEARFDAENVVTGTGTISLADEPVSVSTRLKATLPTLARVSGWSTSFGGPVLRGGSVVVEWGGTGGLAPLSVEGEGSVLIRGVRVDGLPEPLGAEAVVRHEGTSISVTGLKASVGPWRAEGSASWDGQRVEIPMMAAWLNDRRVGEATAFLPFRRPDAKENTPAIDVEAPVSGRVIVQEIDLNRLGADLGRSLPIQGLARGEAAISGTWRTLAGTLDLSASRLRPAKQVAHPLDPASATLKATLRDGQLSVDAMALQRPLEPVRLEARLPFDAVAIMQDPASVNRTALTGRVRLPRSSLGFVPGWVPAIQSVNGTATLEASLGGTLGRPQWLATATVRIPEMRLRGDALPSVRDVVLRVRADEKRLTFEEAGVMLAGGRLRLMGSADLTQLRDPRLDLRVRADEVLLVRDENLSLRANAEVACRGPWAKAEVRGGVELVRGRVFKEIEFLPLSLPNQLPPVPPPTALARTGPPALPPPFDAWTMDVTLRTRDPVRLMGNVARGNVVADLRLGGTGARPVLTGRATMEQMWVRLPFSRLNITEGVISFTEDKPFDPQINVVGESITDGRTVQVMVQGRALDPKVRLTSSPPLPEGDIVSLLATGLTTGDLASNSGEAAGRAAFVALSQAYRRLFPARARRRDDAEPPRLSFEFAFFGSGPSRNSLSAVYELTPHWRVIGRVGEAGTFRGLLHYLIRFR